MTEGFRHLRRERLLSATYVDLNAMIFGMPRAVFPALAIHLYDGGAGVVGLLYAAPGPERWSARSYRLVQSRSPSREGDRACVMAWGLTITLFGITPVLWIGLALLGLAGAADVFSAVFARPSSSAPSRPSPGPAVGNFLCRGGGRPRLGDVETGVAAAIGGPQFAVWSGGVACMIGVVVLSGGCPNCGRTKAAGTRCPPRRSTEPSRSPSPNWAPASQHDTVAGAPGQAWARRARVSMLVSDMSAREGRGWNSEIGWR